MTYPVRCDSKGCILLPNEIINRFIGDVYITKGLGQGACLWLMTEREYRGLCDKIESVPDRKHLMRFLIGSAHVCKIDEKSIKISVILTEYMSIHESSELLLIVKEDKCLLYEREYAEMLFHEKGIIP